MRIFILTFCFFFFRSLSFGQVIVDYRLSMIDIGMFDYFSNHYDTALIRKNKVESCRDSSQIYYFDSIGRVVKSVVTYYEQEPRELLFRYDAMGDTILTEISSPKLAAKDYKVERNYKIYKSGLLVKDSFNLREVCSHFEYYQNGGLRQELFFGGNRSLNHASWFGVDSLARITRVINRDYRFNDDPAGRLTSNRTLFYNGMGQLIKVEEAVICEESKIKGYNCINDGSVTYLYDSIGRLTETTRTSGPSQKIKYLDNGLIDEIESTGKPFVEIPFYHWHWKFDYTYRK